jgi:hypothetical protein
MKRGEVKYSVFRNAVLNAGGVGAREDGERLNGTHTDRRRDTQKREGRRMMMLSHAP